MSRSKLRARSSAALAKSKTQQPHQAVTTATTGTRRHSAKAGKTTNAFSRQTTIPATATTANSSKKEKMREKRMQWLAKLSAADQQQKRKLGRAAQGPLGDMVALLTEALPSVHGKDESMGAPEGACPTPESTATTIKPTTIKPTKHTLVASRKGRAHTREKERLQFRAVLQHPAFRADPLQAIRRHVQLSAQTHQ